MIQLPRHMLGRAHQARWIRFGNYGKGYLQMKRLRTVEEAADKAFRILDRLNPQSLSAFWSRISQLVDPRHRETRPTPRTRGRERRDRLARQLNAIYSTTMGKMETFG